MLWPYGAGAAVLPGRSTQVGLPQAEGVDGPQSPPAPPSAPERTYLHPGTGTENHQRAGRTIIITQLAQVPLTEKKNAKTPPFGLKNLFSYALFFSGAKRNGVFPL